MSDLPVFLSLGAGVQSSTLAMMAAEGEIAPMPVAAIFADTKAEPPSVYRWLDWLEARLPFQVRRVTAYGATLEERESLGAVSKKTGRRYRESNIPSYTGTGGPLARRCTYDFKIVPIIREVRRILIERGVPRLGMPRKPREDRAAPPPVAVQWIGISRDEAHRMKPSREPWVRHEWPLVDRGITRAACVAWMRARGYPEPPRSACVFCPFHSDAEWLRLKREEPEQFARAVALERAMQAVPDETVRSPPYLHSSRMPLDTVVFRESTEKQLELWGNECEGMCGV